MIWDYFEGGGQVVIYDANNGTKATRHAIAEKFDKAGIHVVLLGESPFYEDVRGLIHDERRIYLR